MAVSANYKPIYFTCTEKLNTNRYIRLMRKFKNELQFRHPGLIESQQFVYMQDGAPAHTSNQSIRWLENHFNEVITKRPKKFWDDSKVTWVSTITIRWIYGTYGPELRLDLTFNQPGNSFYSHHIFILEL